MSSQAVSNAKKMGWPLKEVTAGVFETEAPGGYKFYLEDKEQKKEGEMYTCSYLCSEDIYKLGITIECAFVSMALYETGPLLLFLYYFSSRDCKAMHLKL